MTTEQDPPLSGRRRQAARNDEVILDAARAVFLADPSAPIAKVAAQANVGISALYRRYPSKEELLRRLCHDGLARMIHEAERVASMGPGEAFVEFLHGVVDADVHSLTIHLAGTFTPTAEMHADAGRAAELVGDLFRQAQGAGMIRSDAVIGDIELILESCAAIRVPDPARSKELRRRHLALQLDGLMVQERAPLPGPAPTNEMAWRWQGNP